MPITDKKITAVSLGTNDSHEIILMVTESFTLAGEVSCNGDYFPDRNNIVTRPAKVKDIPAVSKILNLT
jgi:hypothetical protein